MATTTPSTATGAGGPSVPGWCLGLLAAAVLGVGLGDARRLSYHEAIVAQGARELLGPGGDWRVPTLDGRPWLEKPPLSHWLVAAVGRLAGGVDEATARLPSALSAALLAGVVARLASRRLGPGVGMLAGAVQLSTAWSIQRGRLAEADIVLALLVAATMAAFDRLRSPVDPPDASPPSRRSLAFFALLGGTAMAKGIGFGAALVLASIAAVLLWDRDARALRRLARPSGWLVAGLIAMAWPLWIATRYPEAVGLWLGHVTDRLASQPRQFAGEPLGTFLLSPFVQVLPWTPFALVGAWHSFARARREPNGPDRLLWAWAAVPMLMLSFASVRNDHYLIHALPPWSIWAALGLSRLGDRLRSRRGWPADRLHRRSIALFAAVGAAVAIAHLALIPRLDDRGREWSWYAEAARHLRPDEPLVLLYDWNSPDPWDRLPYPTPFGPMPHDLAVRLFYLDRPASWLTGPDRLAADPPCPVPFAVIARDRDRPALRRLGTIEELSRGPDHRWDRAYRLFRVSPGEAPAIQGEAVADRGRPDRLGR